MTMISHYLVFTSKIYGCFYDSVGVTKYKKRAIAYLRNHKGFIEAIMREPAFLFRKTKGERVFKMYYKRKIKEPLVFKPTLPVVRALPYGKHHRAAVSDEIREIVK